MKKPKASFLLYDDIISSPRNTKYIKYHIIPHHPYLDTF